MYKHPYSMNMSDLEPQKDPLSLTETQMPTHSGMMMGKPQIQMLHTDIHMQTNSMPIHSAAMNLHRTDMHHASKNLVQMQVPSIHVAKHDQLHHASPHIPKHDLQIPNTPLSMTTKHDFDLHISKQGLPIENSNIILHNSNLHGEKHSGLLAQSDSSLPTSLKQTENATHTLIASSPQNTNIPPIDMNHSHTVNMNHDEKPLLDTVKQEKRKLNKKPKPRKDKIDIPGLRKERGKTYTPLERQRILARIKMCDLWNDGYTISEISRKMKMTRNTVRHWIQKGEETGDLSSNPRQGGPRKTTPDIDEAIVKYMQTHPVLNATEIQKHMNIAVSAETIRKRLRESGVWRKPEKGNRIRKGYRDDESDDNTEGNLQQHITPSFHNHQYDVDQVNMNSSNTIHTVKHELPHDFSNTQEQVLRNPYDEYKLPITHPVDAASAFDEVLFNSIAAYENNQYEGCRENNLNSSQNNRIQTCESPNSNKELPVVPKKEDSEDSSEWSGSSRGKTYTQLEKQRIESRTKIVEMHKLGYPVAEIARELGITRQTVRVWIRREEESGDLSSNSRPGGPRKTAPEIDFQIYQCFKEHPNFTATQIHEKLRLECSVETVRKRLRETGMYQHRTPVKKCENEQQKKKCKISPDKETPQPTTNVKKTKGSGSSEVTDTEEMIVIPSVKFLLNNIGKKQNGAQIPPRSLLTNSGGSHLSQPPITENQSLVNQDTVVPTQASAAFIPCPVYPNRIPDNSAILNRESVQAGYLPCSEQSPIHHARDATSHQSSGIVSSHGLVHNISPHSSRHSIHHPDPSGLSLPPHSTIDTNLSHSIGHTISSHPVGHSASPHCAGLSVAPQSSRLPIPHSSGLSTMSHSTGHSVPSHSTGHSISSHSTGHSSIPSHSTTGHSIPSHSTGHSSIPSHSTTGHSIPSHSTTGHSSIPSHSTGHSSIPSHSTGHSSIPSHSTGHPISSHSTGHSIPVNSTGHSIDVAVPHSSIHPIEHPAPHSSIQSVQIESREPPTPAHSTLETVFPHSTDHLITPPLSTGQHAHTHAVMGNVLPHHSVAPSHSTAHTIPHAHSSVKS